MKSILPIALGLLLSHTAIAAQSVAMDQADALEKNLLAWHLKQAEVLNVTQDSVDKLLDGLNRVSGRWDKAGALHLSYPADNNVQTSSAWAQHLYRTAALFRGWRRETNPIKQKGSADLAKACTLAMNAYMVTVPFRGKDYKNQYDHPYADLVEARIIGESGIYARANASQFPQSLIEKWSNKITTVQNRVWDLSYALPPGTNDHFKNFWTEANQFWITRSLVTVAVTQSLESNRIKGLDTLFDNLWYLEQRAWPIRNPMEGFTVDGLQGSHGIPYTGSDYDFFGDIINAREWTKGISRAEWKGPDFDKILIDVLLDGTVPASQQYIDIQVTGKGFHHVPTWNQVSTHAKSLLNSPTYNGYRKKELEAAILWSEGKVDWPFPNRTFKLYHTADYATMHFPKHMVSFRGVSSRTIGTETFDQVAKKMYDLHVYFPLGASFIYGRSNEYRAWNSAGIDSCIWSAFDFARVPGVTTQHVDSNTLKTAWNQSKSSGPERYIYGNTDFAGGVNDSTSGVFGWEQGEKIAANPPPPKVATLSVAGKHGVFFLSNAVVHLSSDFTFTNTSAPVYTSFDQRRSSGAATYYSRGGKTISLKPEDAAVTGNDISWVWHDNVGYMLPKGQKIVVQDKLQKGTFGFAAPRIKYANTPDRQVFSAWADHGSTQKDLAFEWAVFPGATTSQMDALTGSKPWKTLSNTPDIQAVRVDKDPNGWEWTGIVFHNKSGGKLISGELTIQAKRACILVVRQKGELVHVSAGDPLNDNLALDLTITSSKSAKPLLATLSFNSGNMSGSTVGKLYTIPGYPVQIGSEASHSRKVQLQATRLTVELPGTMADPWLEVRSVNGQKLALLPLVNTSAGQYQADGNGLPKGIVWIRVLSERKSVLESSLFLP